MDMKNVKIDDDNTVTVEGIGRDLGDISTDYLQLMELDFNLSTNNIVDYLRVTTGYVQKDVVKYLRKIPITGQVRRGLRLYYQKHRLTFLFSKRRLYSRTDFQNYLLERANEEKTYHRLYYNDFSPDFLERVAKIAGIKRKTNFVFKKDEEESFEEYKRNLSIPLSKLTEMVQPKLRLQQESVNTEHKLEKMPDQLMSMQDIIKYFEFDHVPQGYKLVEERRVPKIYIDNLVRYSKEQVMKIPLVTVQAIYDVKELKEALYQLAFELDTLE